MVPVLTASGVSYRPHDRLVLDRIDLGIRSGEFVGLIGPNGAGKTTLLRVLAKLLAPTAGAVQLDGQALSRLSRREVAQSIALLPQAAPPAEFAFPVQEVVLMGRYPYRGRFQPETPDDHAIAQQAMKVTDTEELARRMITELSGGERQRVLLARALAQQPRLLLLDEPTANLDLCHQLDVFKLARRLAQTDGRAVLAATHDLEWAGRYCDRLLLLHAGRLVAEGSPEAVLTPERLAAVFGVQARVAPDPFTGALSITVLDQTIPHDV